jgi:hypothetical protein
MDEARERLMERVDRLFCRCWAPVFAGGMFDDEYEVVIVEGMASGWGSEKTRKHLEWYSGAIYFAPAAWCVPLCGTYMVEVLSPVTEDPGAVFHRFASCIGGRFLWQPDAGVMGLFSLEQKNLMRDLFVYVVENEGEFEGFNLELALELAAGEWVGE